MELDIEEYAKIREASEVMKRGRGGKRPAKKCGGRITHNLSSPSSFGNIISGFCEYLSKRNDMRGQKISAYQGLDIDAPG